MRLTSQSQIQLFFCNRAVHNLPAGVRLHQLRKRRLEEVDVIKRLEGVRNKGSSKATLRVTGVRVSSNHDALIFPLPNVIHQTVQVVRIIVPQPPGRSDVNVGLGRNLLKSHVVGSQNLRRHAPRTFHNNVRLIRAFVILPSAQLKITGWRDKILLACGVSLNTLHEAIQGSF